MKKSCYFESYEAFNKATEKNDDLYREENRFVIIRGTKNICGVKYSGVEIFSTICGVKKLNTVKKHLIRAAAEYGIKITMDELESNINVFAECGYSVEIENAYDDVWNISYMCFQDEVEESTTERYYFTTDNADLGEIDERICTLDEARKIAKELTEEYKCDVCINDVYTEEMIDWEFYTEPTEIINKSEEIIETNYRGYFITGSEKISFIYVDPHDKFSSVPYATFNEVINAVDKAISSK